MFQKFPYTDNHELNLDWIIKKIKELENGSTVAGVASVNGETGVVTITPEKIGAVSANGAIQKIKFCQYNIGKFNFGIGGGMSGISAVEKAINNYKQFFCNENPDFLTFQELTEFIGANDTYNAELFLFQDHFRNSSYYEKETQIKAQYPLSNSAFSYLHTTGDNPAWCIYADTVVNGVNIRIVSAVLNSSAPEGVNHQAQALRALTKLVNTIIADAENVIIGMDTNMLSQNETEVIKTFMETNGYKCGNWDYLGYQNTYNLNVNMYNAIDNIFVKGNLAITNFYVPDVYDDLTSDHYPVIAEINVYGG